jgi:enoyl reductase-like protein
VKYAGTLPLSVTVYGAARSYGEHIATFKALNIVFNPETKLIDLTLFEERQDVAVPLSLQFQYCPSQGFAPIHEIASGRNEHIKQFYWKLWFGDESTMRCFPTLIFTRSLWARMLLSIRVMWNSSVLWQETKENPSRLRGTTTSRRPWILPLLLAGK